MKSKRYLGVISEGISKRVYGKATLGKKTGAEFGSVSSVELKKAGIFSPGDYLEKGGQFKTRRLTK